MTSLVTKKSSRNDWIKVAIVVVLLIILIVGVRFVPDYKKFALSVPPQDAPYRLSSVPIEDRVEDLLSRMTLEEKVGQMALVEKNSVHDIYDVATYNIGALLSGAGAKPDVNTAQGWKDMVAEYVAISKASRLGIPVLYGADAIHGHTNVPGATVFPHAISLGATRDAELTERVARATAKELAQTGILWSYSPNLDLPQDIRWGRTYETFTDDSTLASSLGAAYVRGVTAEGVMATAKHYLGAGGMLWGSSSNKDFFIDQGMTVESETLLREVYLPPFKAAVDAGAGSVMVGLNSWGKEKLSTNKYLITDILKGELNFNGVVVSDWYGVYEIPGGDYRAAVVAINAGIDLIMLPFEYKAFITNVTRGVELGEISQERIDDAVRRILTAKFKLGLFDSQPSNKPVFLGSSEHQELAREVVQKSLVLLKNDNEILPINDDIASIRIAGNAANNAGLQSGAWTVEWQGVDGNWLPDSTSILEGIWNRSHTTRQIEFEENAEFPNPSAKADLGIAIIGETPYAEGWGDSELPTLTTEDLAVIERLKETSERVVVVIVAGRPLIIDEHIGSWDGLVIAWLPGTRGEGVADVLFGDVPFMGSLPLPWPRTISQVPIAPDGTTADGTLPLFPRFFGIK